MQDAVQDASYPDSKSAYKYELEDGRWKVYVAPAKGIYNNWDWDKSIRVDIHDAYTLGYNEAKPTVITSANLLANPYETMDGTKKVGHVFSGSGTCKIYFAMNVQWKAANASNSATGYLKQNGTVIATISLNPNGTVSASGNKTISVNYSNGDKIWIETPLYTGGNYATSSSNTLVFVY